MGDFIYFTEEQKERANAVPIMDILKREHEEVERSGSEWRWKCDVPWKPLVQTQPTDGKPCY